MSQAREGGDLLEELKNPSEWCPAEAAGEPTDEDEPPQDEEPEEDDSGEE
jgi:hypothetical protein